MTIVEFYDKADIENVAGAILCNPEKIILVGGTKTKMNRSKDVYMSILSKRGINSQIECRVIGKNNLNNIYNLLEEIVLNEQDCVFDLTGGDDLYLVAVGRIIEKYRDKIQCHRFNFMNNMLYDCDTDGRVLSTAHFHITAEENIGIYGGKIVWDNTREFYTYPWDFNDEFARDIDRMWSVCRKHPGQWNVEIGVIGMICALFGDESTLKYSLNKAEVLAALEENGIQYTHFSWITDQLEEFGLLNDVNMADRIEFEFKNEQIKRSLTIEGQVLELVIARNLIDLKDEDGSPFYQDVMVGAVIDWDFADNDTIKTLNEIDIIAMKDAIPVFVSCKNGKFDVNELYKLYTVSERFGGKYVKKVLVCSRLGSLGPNSVLLRARMQDMGIKCVDNICFLSHENVSDVVKTFWNS